MTKPIAQKSATYLKPSEGLTASQRRTLGLALTPPRKRDPREATPTTICRCTTATTLCCRYCSYTFTFVRTTLWCSK